MGFGSFVKSIAGPAIGLATGNPLLGAAVGAGIGAVSGNSALPGGGFAGRAPRPEDFIAINLPSVEYPRGFQTVDYPEVLPDQITPYPTLPRTQFLPQLPEDIPTLPAVFMDPTTGERLSLDTAAQANNVLQALLNPNSKLIRDLARDETQLLRNDRLRVLQDLQRSDRREKALGRPGLFGGERGAENIARVLAQGAQDTELRGRLNARDLARTTADDLRRTSALYGDLARLETGRRDAFRGDLATMIAQLRNDTATRNQQSRSDIAGRIAEARGDILAADQRTRTNAGILQQNDINRLNAALRINPTSDFRSQQLGFEADQLAFDAQRNNAFAGLAGNVFGALMRNPNAEVPGTRSSQGWGAGELPPWQRAQSTRGFADPTIYGGGAGSQGFGVFY